MPDLNNNVVKYWRKNPKAIEKYQFVHNFLPNESKKKRAGFLSHKALIAYCFIIIAITTAFRIIPKVAPGVLGYASNIVVSDLLKYTNKKRQEAGVSTLVMNDQLSSAAAAKADHMFKNDYWAHISPDGTEPWDFIVGSGYKYVYAGENLAKNFSNSKDVVEAWYNSPSHKDNLLSPNYDEIGFAVVNGVLDGYETTLVVQMFGRPSDRSRLVAAKPVEEPVAPAPEEVVVEVPAEEVAPATDIMPDYSVVQVTPKVDVSHVSKGISLIFAGFVAMLLAIDIWYSRKRGIFKFTGHTFAHLMLFIVAIASIWFVLKPGVII